MNEAIETAIKILAQRISEKTAANEAMALSQAALNMAHVMETLAGTKNLEKRTDKL